MAKKSAVERNKKRSRMSQQQTAKRAALRSITRDKEASPEDRFSAMLKLADLPRNGSSTRIRNRCEMTGRPRAYYRKLRLSRIMLRGLASAGQIPGMVKASW